MAESLGSARAAVYRTLEGEQGEAAMAEGLTISVDQNRTETVQGNETITIGKDRTERVHANETVTIDKNRTETVQEIGRASCRERVCLAV